MIKNIKIIIKRFSLYMNYVDFLNYKNEINPYSFINSIKRYFLPTKPRIILLLTFIRL